MGYWTDWYVADEANAGKIARDESSDLPQLTLDSVIQTDLDDLAELLGAEYIEAMEILVGDPMVIVVPHSFVFAIANLADERVAEIAEKWGSMDEMDIRSSLDLPTMLGAMKKLCSQSLAAGKSILERAA